MKNLKSNIKRALAILGVCVFTLCSLTGCSQAQRASYNIKKQADNFNVLRQVTVINCITNDIIVQMTGKFSVEVDEVENQLELTVENEDGSYGLHFIGLNKMISYTVIDLDTNYVDAYKFTMNFNPDMWIPVGFEEIE